MPEEPRPELDVDAVGRVRKKIGPESAERDIENREQPQSHRKHLECRIAAMDKHFVDHELEEEGSEKLEELEKE